MRVLRVLILLAAVLPAVACSSEPIEPTGPTERSLRDSFAAQLSANPAVSVFTRDGDVLTFTGPGLDGSGTAQWRVHIDSAVVEPYTDQPWPYKGTVKSSWSADGQPVRPDAEGRRSNLPEVLTATGLAQDCWANWDAAAGRWGWE